MISISECKIETEENSPPKKILIHFYLYITLNIDITASRKYLLLKKAPDVIKNIIYFQMKTSTEIVLNMI